MSTSILESKSPKAVIPDLAKTCELLNKSSETFYQILQSQWRWIEQARAMTVAAYMHDTHEEIANFPEMVEKMSDLLFESMKNDAPSAMCLDLMKELQEESQRLSGVPKGS